MMINVLLICTKSNFPNINELLSFDYYGRTLLWILSIMKVFVPICLLVYIYVWLCVHICVHECYGVYCTIIDLIWFFEQTCCCRYLMLTNVNKHRFYLSVYFLWHVPLWKPNNQIIIKLMSIQWATWISFNRTSKWGLR